MPDVDMCADDVLAVADDLAAAAAAVDAMARYARECAVPATWPDGPGPHHRFAARLGGAGDDAAGTFAHGAALLADLADALRAGARSATAADHRGAADLTAAGE